MHLVGRIQIENINDIPDHAEGDEEALIKKFGNHTHKSIKILDISIDKYLKHKDLFIDSIKLALPRVKEIQILLLHPETYANEQRGKRLSAATRSLQIKMKNGLSELQEIIDDFDDVNKHKISIKLFKSPPFMVYTSWDNNANFCILKQDYKKGDYFFVRTTTPLFTMFQKHFNDLVASSDITLEDYLYLSIKSKKNKISNVFWGGDSERREIPRYITSKSDHLELERICREKETVTIFHDKLPNRAQIRQIDSEGDMSNKLEYAKSQIAKNYCSGIDLGNNRIYELIYFYESRQILLQDRYSVSQKLTELKYAFVPHNEYDVALTQYLWIYMESIYKCYDHLLQIDERDEAELALKQHSDPDYVSLPRRKLFAVFNIKLKENQDPDVKLEETNADYPLDVPVKIRETDVKLTKIPRKTIADLKKSKDKEVTANLDHLEPLLHMIKTTIIDDLHYIFGTKDFINMTSDFKVYVHCIRTMVAKGISKTSETTDTSTVTPNMPYDYQVTHLIKRKNIFGGSNTIKKDGMTDSFLLETPLDTIFYVTKTDPKGNESISHEAEPIYLKESSEKEGIRDVLVIEIKKTS